MPVLRVLGKGTDREREGRMGSQEQAPPPGTAGRLGRWYEQIREEVDGGQGQAEASTWTSCSREGTGKPLLWGHAGRWTRAVCRTWARSPTSSFRNKVKRH